VSVLRSDSVLRRGSATYFVLIGCRHGKVGRFTGYSLSLSSDEVRSVKMTSDERYERSLIRGTNRCHRKNTYN